MFFGRWSHCLSCFSLPQSWIESMLSKNCYLQTTFLSFVTVLLADSSSAKFVHFQKIQIYRNLHFTVNQHLFSLIYYMVFRASFSIRCSTFPQLYVHFQPKTETKNFSPRKMTLIDFTDCLQSTKNLNECISHKIVTGMVCCWCQW